MWAFVFCLRIVSVKAVMQPFLFVLFVAIATGSVSGKTIVFFEETDTHSALPNAGGSDLALEADDDSKTITDDLDEWEADAFGELTPEDLHFLLNGYEYTLQKCGGGECKVCFKLWKLNGCFIVKLTSGGIYIEVQAFGKTLYSKTFSTGGSYTVRISKDKLPSPLPKLLKSDIEITFSGLDLAAKKVCMQVQADVKLIGTVKWPRSSPYCLQL